MSDPSPETSFDYGARERQEEPDLFPPTSVFSFRPVMPFWWLWTLFCLFLTFAIMSYVVYTLDRRWDAVAALVMWPPPEPACAPHGLPPASSHRTSNPPPLQSSLFRWAGPNGKSTRQQKPAVPPSHRPPPSAADRRGPAGRLLAALVGRARKRLSRMRTLGPR